MELTAVLADQRIWDGLRDLNPSRGESAPPEQPKVRQRQVRLGADAQEGLVSAYLDGETIDQLAERFGIHRTTAITILDRHGIHRRYRLLQGEALQVAFELYAAGRSLAEVGRHFGLDPSTVQRTFAREGIPRRDTHGR